jgi:hypothetical protein
MAGLGVAGDSLSDEYASAPYDYAQNWVELLAESRSVDFGPVADWGEPRREGHQYNWARAGATSQTLIDDLQHTGLAGQVSDGSVSHAVLAVGPNDFFDESLGYAYVGIYLGTWSEDQVDAFTDRLVGNVETAVATLTATGVGLVLSSVVDYGVAPVVQQFLPNADRRDQVSQVVADVNDRIRLVALRHQVPLVDANAMARDFLGDNHAPVASLTVGGVEIVNAAGEAPHHAFVDDGIHPHTVIQGIFANLFLEAFRLGYGVDVAPLTEAEIVTAAGLAYQTDTLDVAYSDYVILPEVTARFDVTLTRAPSAVDDVTGERSALPSSETWIDEWTSFVAEIWVSTPATDLVGVVDASVDLVYDTECFTPTLVEYGPAFTPPDETEPVFHAGWIEGIFAETMPADVGDDGWALFARVFFEPAGDGAGCRHDADGHYLTAAGEIVLGLSNPQVHVEHVGQAAVDVGEPARCELWPVMYDVDDDGRVGFGDLAFFAEAFGHDVGGPFTWAVDFDRSGRVDTGDLAFLAENFHASGAGPLVYPASFPTAWRADDRKAAAATPDARSAASPAIDMPAAESTPEATTALSWGSSSWWSERSLLAAGELDLWNGRDESDSPVDALDEVFASLAAFERTRP